MDTPYNLILKFLHDECTLEEVQTLAAWRQASQKNETTYTELLQAWRIIDPSSKEVVIPDKDKVWDNIRQQIQEEEENTTTPSSYPVYSTKKIISIIAIAASVALFIGIATTFAFLYHFPFPVTYAKFEAPRGNKSQMTLPDGTKVWLNSGSQITYGSNYNQKQRVVQLNGEAYFDVTKNPQCPFIVKVGSVDVKVLGTAFDVNAYNEDPSITVSLVRGLVSIESNTDQSRLALLHPNQKVVINKANLLCALTACDAVTESIWINNKLRFDGKTPDMLFKQLNRWYGVNFTVEKAPQDRRYWLTLKSESLTETLQLINKITPIDYTIKGEEVTINYK